eukprot:scaffold28046_cov19-Tisochrysis_lutea.AAC.3
MHHTTVSHQHVAWPMHMHAEIIGNEPSLQPSALGSSGSSLPDVWGPPRRKRSALQGLQTGRSEQTSPLPTSPDRLLPAQWPTPLKVPHDSALPAGRWICCLSMSSPPGCATAAGVFGEGHGVNTLMCQESKAET